ncbi:CDP-glycerol glycerophosphotransferase family protein [Salinicola sp. CPA57]|uniref:CDP-glycerol glycerophosphotransferase family protein n=1 Tax=Salinicola sp. CPA57 TaxID=1949080 RepID=UPI000DA22B55|nr:CDP-glycerol glycerophosphotransferase family protein [Salinicola sp. CPA57]
MRDVIAKVFSAFNIMRSKNPKAYNSGLVQFRNKKWLAAEKLFLVAIDEKPDHAPSYFKLGMSEFRQKKYDLAYNHIALALEKNPTQSQWSVQLSQALNNAVSSSKKPSWEKEKLLRSHLAEYPENDLELRKQLVNLLKKQGKWWQEQEQLEVLVSRDDSSADLYFRLGEINEVKTAREAAFRYFEKAIHINDSQGVVSPANWYYRAGYLLQCTGVKSQDENGQNSYYDKAIALDDSLDAKRYGIGVFHQQRALWKAARDAYLDQLLNHPIDGELHYCAGLAYDHCNQWEEAARHYQIGLAISGGLPKWHYKLAYVLEMQEKWDPAIDAYRYAILMHSRPPAQWRRRLGSVLQKVGRNLEAAEANIATREKPGIDLQSDEIDASLRSYKDDISVPALYLLEEESRKHPDEASPWYSLGKIYEKTERWGQAVDAYEKAIERKSIRSTYWYYRLAYALYSDKKVDKALSVFNALSNELILAAAYKKEVSLTLSDFIYSGGVYRFWFKVSFKYPLLAVDVHSLIINQREVYEESGNSFHFLPSIHYQSKDEIYCSFDVDLRDMDLAFLYHDYSISMTLFAEDGCRYEVQRKTNILIEDVKEKLREYPLSFSFSQDHYIIYPYLTASQKSISFIKRHYNQFDDEAYRELEIQAYEEYKENEKSLKDMKVWLIFEKFSNTAQDNAYYFFLDIVNKRENVYYVIDKDSPDRQNLVGYEDHVVDFMSKKHMLLLLSCELMISSETRGHAYAWRRVFGPFREAVFNKPYVFLQHGVTAMKKNDINLAKTSHICAADRFVVTCEFERNVILRDNFGYLASELIVAPFPRWHTFVDQSEKFDEIFLMPTWRNWLEGLEDEEFRATEYFKEYTSLLSSLKLAEVLDRYKVKLNFYLHPKIIEQLKHFDVVSDHVNLIQFGQASVRDLLMRAKLLITDYSSVAWDFYYLKKPVLFFQFDVDKYLTYHGSHIDFRSELPGEVLQTEDDLLSEIDRCLESYSQEKFKAEKVGECLFGKSLGINGSDVIYKELVSYCQDMKCQ